MTTTHHDSAPIVTLVAVNYFGAILCERLLASLVRQLNPRWELHLVDNSCDRTETEHIRELTKTDHRAHLTVSRANLGYFGGALSLLETLNVMSDWTVICNVDVELATVDFIDRLVEMPSENGVLAPQIKAVPSGRDLNPFMVVPPTRAWLRSRQVIFERTSFGQLYTLASAIRSRTRGRRTNDDTKMRSIYAPHGSFILMHRSLIEKAGLPRYPLFLFGEEIVIAEYACEAQRTVIYVPQLKVLHYEHQSTGGTLRSRAIIRAQADAAAYSLRLVTGELQPEPRSGI